jgi:hypothetical protein
MLEDGAIIPAGPVAESTGDPTLADPGRDGVTMPGVWRVRWSSTTRFIPASVNWSRWCTANGSPERSIWLSSKPTAHSR